MKRKLKNRRFSYDLPLEIVNGYYMEIFSNKEIVINSDAEITKLSDAVLKIKCGEHALAFYGKNIKIDQYSSSGIKLLGEFSSVEFIETEKDNDKPIL